MILTGKEIIKERERGDIIISPFSIKQINPNSYNYRLGEFIKIYEGFNGDKPLFKEIKISKEGYKLTKGVMYLGSTAEVIGSKKYMTSLIGKSSLGRLGMFLQLSANIGHTGTLHNWTLEIYATKDIIIYPNMIIGQVTFWKNSGDLDLYEGDYKKYNKPQESLINN